MDFYLEHQRWREASTAAQAYLEVYPHDYDFALYAGAELTTNRRYAEGIPLLDLVFERKPSYEAYQALGWALSYSRNNVRAAQVLEASLALDPDDFQAYYHLGYVYRGLGRYADAIAMFEKVLERQPNNPRSQCRDCKASGASCKSAATRGAQEVSPGERYRSASYPLLTNSINIDIRVS